ncbi:MAG: hypothetical protein ACI4EK_04540 [Wujia sp.]
MQFSDKLDLLMRVSQVTNKELATAISVDPSLISLLRSGKRKQPHNHNHIKNMAVFFSQKCPSDFQRNALSEILGQNSIRPSMPIEVLAGRLEQWLTKDQEITEHLLNAMNSISRNPQEKIPPIVESESELVTEYYFGEDGRRTVIRKMMNLICETQTPGPILIVSDDNLEWMLSDYTLTRQIQSSMIEVLNRGFTLHQIMPAVNFLPRYAEALHFWLPVYSTGQVKVYYYPRLRDNLYRRSLILLPGRCMRLSTSIGLESNNDITLFSTDPQLVHAFHLQFQEHLSLCKPALSVYSDHKDFARLFWDLNSKQGNQINLATSLSPLTLPREHFERFINQTDDMEKKQISLIILDRIADFEELLKQRTYIDMAKLATPKEIREGRVYIASTQIPHPDRYTYTAETYILHLQNILRLMEEYDNYYFIPYEDENWNQYNLIVNDEGIALLGKVCEPFLMLEMKRPELVIACNEYLIRKAEKLGYAGVHKQKTQIQIQRLIKELKRS